MILTKSEFRDEFGFKNLSSVSNLLKSKSIVETADGLIDLSNKKKKRESRKNRKKKKRPNVKINKAALNLIF